MKKHQSRRLKQDQMRIEKRVKPVRVSTGVSIWDELRRIEQMPWRVRLAQGRSDSGGGRAEGYDG